MLRVTVPRKKGCKIFRSDHKCPRFRLEAVLTALVYVYGFGFDDRVLRARSLACICTCTYTRARTRCTHAYDIEKE